MRTLVFPTSRVGWLVARPWWAGPRDPECVQLGTARGAVDVPDRDAQIWVELHVTAGRLDFLDQVDPTGLDAVDVPQFALPVGDTGLGHLLRFSQLRGLAVESRRVRGSAVRDLAALSKLESFGVGDILAAPRDFDDVAALPLLRHLALVRCAADDATVKRLSPTIERLSLLATRVGDDGARSIATLPRLRDLSLHGSRVGDDGVAALALVKSLRTLQLGETAVTAEGLSALSRLPGLAWLNLYRCPAVDRRAVEVLAGLTSLTDLVVSGTALDENDVTRLRRALPRCVVSGP